jgi:metal-dependent amidase/aminoacylase/carboxypeptidase family protein
MTTPSFLDSIGSQLDWQREVYKDLHRDPEVSFDEHKTADRIAAELTVLGLDASRIGEIGRVAVIENAEGPTVLARADIDALPVTEDTGLDFASEVDGVMHACGHDMHAAALLGAVRLLNENRDAWSGTYIALFQPAEENAAGAKAMIDDGLTSKIPAPDVALAQHVMPMPAGKIYTSAGPVMSAGDSVKIYTSAGPVMSAGDSVKITVFGRGAHGSMPHLSVDTVVIAAAIVLRLQTIVSRETEPGEFSVVTVGASNAGPKSNIIPDRAELLLNVRTYDTAVRKRVIASIERIIRGECDAAGTPKEPTFEYFDQFPLTVNSEAVNDTITEAVQEATPATASDRGLSYESFPCGSGIRSRS